MTDDGTSDPGNVSSQETDPRLLAAAVRRLGLAEVAVDPIHGRFKGRKFDHGVGNLPSPERVQTFVESVDR